MCFVQGGKGLDVHVGEFSLCCDCFKVIMNVQQAAFEFNVKCCKLFCYIYKSADVSGSLDFSRGFSWILGV